jgi:hypothetical protein
VLPYDAESGDCTTKTHPKAQTWVRLKLENHRPSVAAEGVQVTVHRVQQRSGERDGSLPNLAENDDRPLRWADRTDGTIDIPGGASRRFDLIRLDDLTEHTDAELAFFDPPEDRRQELPPGEYSITVCATSRNSRPVYQTVALKVNSDWKRGEPLANPQLTVSDKIAHKPNERQAGSRF